MDKQALNLQPLSHEHVLVFPRAKSKSTDIRAVPLDTVQMGAIERATSRVPVAGAMLAIAAHASLVLALTHQYSEPVMPSKAKPITVSLIAPPAPEPELVPIIAPPEPPKPEPPKPVKKKIVKKIEPKPVIPIREEVELASEKVEPPPQQELAKIEPTPAPLPVELATVTKAPPPVEEKYEPPRFGVSYLNNPAPDYPRLSRRFGEEGRVLMRVLVNAQGSPETVAIERSSGFERLDKAAVEAVKHWRFIPANKNNVALSAYVVVPMRFSLAQ